MRLIQRLASGMCEARAEVLRKDRQEVGNAARTREWKDLPARVKALLLRAAALKDEMDDVESQIQRAGYVLPNYNVRKTVRNHEALPYKDAQKREQDARAALDKRVEAIKRRKEKALRDTLGMNEINGKRYLAELETELNRI